MSDSAPPQLTEHLNAPVAAPPGSPRYFAWLYSTGALRTALHTLFAIEQEIRSGLRAGMEHHVAHVRLEWWQAECERFASGHPLHPLTRSLATQLGKSPSGDLSGLVDTARWDLAGATFETREEIEGYCERWASAVVETATSCVTIGDRQHLGVLGQALGKVLREMELLSALDHEAQSGRLRLPLQELEQANIDPASLAKPPWSDALSHLVRERHRALRAQLASSAGSLPAAVQPQLSGLLVWATLASQQSRRAERALPNALPPRHTVAFADAWSGWRAARHALKGSYQSDDVR